MVTDIGVGRGVGSGTNLFLTAANGQQEQDQDPGESTHSTLLHGPIDGDVWDKPSKVDMTPLAMLGLCINLLI